MELKRYASLLWRWMWLVMLCAVLGGAAAYAYSSQQTPMYAASTTLLINPARTGNASSDYNSLLTSNLLAKTYSELLVKRPVMEAVIASLKLDVSPESLANRVSVSVVRDTQLIALTVQDTDPQRAAQIANEVVQVFSQQNSDLQSSRFADSQGNLQRQMVQLQDSISQTQSNINALKDATSPNDIAERERQQTLLGQYRNSYATLFNSLVNVRLAQAQSTDNLNIVETANPELQPVSPKTKANTLLGIIVGFGLALGIALLVEYLDDRVKTSEQTSELTEAMTLGVIAKIAGPNTESKLVMTRDVHSPIAESYRMLRISLDFAAVYSPLQTIVVTSSNPEEGKSTTIANLAVAIAQAGKRVILVDSDLRRPTLHKIFEVSNERGVTTALLNPGEHGLTDHLVNSGVDNLRLLLSGPIPPNPTELLGSQRMSHLIESLKEQADVVLFDMPPLLLFADAALLAQSCDGTLLVVRAGFTRTDALVRAREQLKQSGARLRGVVFNRVVSRRDGNSAYRYYHTYQDDNRQKPRRLLNWLWPFSSRRRGNQPTSLSLQEGFSFQEASKVVDGDYDNRLNSKVLEQVETPVVELNGRNSDHSGSQGDLEEVAAATVFVTTVSRNGYSSNGHEIL